MGCCQARFGIVVRSTECVEAIGDEYAVLRTALCLCHRLLLCNAYAAVQGTEAMSSVFDAMYVKLETFWYLHHSNRESCRDLDVLLGANKRN